MVPHISRELYFRLCREFMTCNHFGIHRAPVFYLHSVTAELYMLDEFMSVSIRFWFCLFVCLVGICWFILCCCFGELGVVNYV